MSHDLHKGSFQFTVKPSLREQDFIARLAGVRGGGMYAYFDLGVTEDKTANPCQHKKGDVIMAFESDSLRFFRLDDNLRFCRMTVE